MCVCRASAVGHADRTQFAFLCVSVVMIIFVTAKEISCHVYMYICIYVQYIYIYYTTKKCCLCVRAPEGCVQGLLRTHPHDIIAPIAVTYTITNFINYLDVNLQENI